MSYCAIHVAMHLVIGLYLHRSFNNPLPSEHLIRDAVAHFTFSIDYSLRTDCIRHTVIRIPYCHDIFRFLFKDKDTDKLQLTDFTTDYFPCGWNQWCQQYSSSNDVSYCGRTIVFPIKICTYLKWTRPNGFVKITDRTVQPKQRTFVEMIRIYICKNNI